MSAKKSRKKQRQTNPALSANVPSAATIFRARIFDRMSYELLNQAQDRLKPVLWLRDGKKVQQIEAANGVQEMLDQMLNASGLGETAWHRKMQNYGPEALPLMHERLAQAQNMAENDRDAINELLISHLRWRGPAGGRVIRECFESLDDYGKSLASVALGLMGEKASRDQIWDYYQKVFHNHQERFFVGALWGLIDLGDARATAALLDWLDRKFYFYELFGFLSLAGDEKALIPLLVLANELDKEARSDPMMAVVGISQRLGRQALLTSLLEGKPQDEPDQAAEGIADMLLSVPRQDVEEYFSLFYRGFEPEDASQFIG